jgi:tetratricopeptide (TPR) repeat protein
MTPKAVALRIPLAVLVFTATNAFGQTAGPTDFRTLMRQGGALMAQNRLHEAAAAFQRAVDLDPSSAKAHEELGVALARQIMSGNVRPANDVDIADRAESHLRQAADLAPSTAGALIQLSQLEAFLADRSPDAEERSERYGKSREALKRVIDLKPGDAALYLQLANLERDEFGPVIQSAKARDGKNPGPVSDLNARRMLQQHFANLIDDAIANATRASELNGHSGRPLLLLSKLLRERALLRDTPEQYEGDIRSSEQLRLQFMATGGHTGESDSGREQ